MSSYKDVISKMQYHLGKKDQGYNFPLFKAYNKTVGNIIPGVYSVIGGGPGTGRTSFVDSNYVMNVLLQWYIGEERPPLKIFYFTMIDDGFKKMQKLLCTYMMLVEGLRIDVPTLNSQPGRLFNISERDDLLSALDDAQTFFSGIEDEGVLEILEGRRAPSEIYATVLNYMKEIGNDPERKPYELHEDQADGLVMVVVDSVEGLLPEADGYGTTVKDDLSRKIIGHSKKLARRYNVNVNLIVPTEIGFTRFPRETVPASKHLGIFGKNCDRGIIIYNPINERALDIVIPGEDPASYVSAGINTLRLWYVVRNTDGADIMFERFYILPGTGFVIEHLLENDVINFDSVYPILMDTPSPYLE